MNASELIEELQKLIEAHGDLMVCVVDDRKGEIYHEPTDVCHFVSSEHSEYFIIY